MIDMYTLLIVLIIPLFDILPKERISPSGNENNKVRKNISTVVPIPFISCKIIVDALIKNNHALSYVLFPKANIFC